MRRCLPLLAIALLALPACGSDSSSTATTTRTTAPAAHLDRITFERSGGVAAPRVPDRLVITDRAQLDALAALIPSDVRAPDGGPTGCADCRAYTVTLVDGATVHTYRFTEDAVPPPLRRLVAALSAQL